MTAWLPPLLCPIPKNHACHYATNTPHSWTRIQAASGKTTAILHRLLQQQNRKTEGLFVDLEQPSTYYRLFKRRTADKRQKYKKDKSQYIMFDPNGKFIRLDYTLVDAERNLELDTTLYRNKYKKLTRKEIPVGSYVLKVIEDWEQYNWEIPTIHDLTPVAVKRCKSCPNKTSTQGMCHCGFWSAIKDGTHTKVWWTIHDRKMYDIREAKKQKKVLRIKIGLQDLFDN